MQGSGGEEIKGIGTGQREGKSQGERACFVGLQIGTDVVQYINFARTVQNMSHFDLCGDTIQHFPDYPKLGQSLLLIETQKNCPMGSNHNFEALPPLEDPEDIELSLELKMDKAAPEGINSAATIKRKKGGCTCKKTKCLKMYCECFSSGKLCGEDCNCQGCSNCQEHSETLLKAHELVRSKAPEGRAAGKGCNCKKSQCQKKYCECFNAGLPCGKECKCINCQNCDHVKPGPREGSTEPMVEVQLD